MRRIRFEGALDAGATLYSGQAFRWRPAGAGWHEGFVCGVPVRVRVHRDRLEADAARDCSERDLRHYFRLDGSHERFLREVRRDAVLDHALASVPGLRLLQQDPWEVFVSYIVSANSNVAKISRTLEALADRFGAERPPGQAGRNTFPGPEALARARESELRATGMGYRAPYLREAARLVARGDLDPGELSRWPYEEAHARLVGVPGVGPKVADCILLYGCGHMGAFPVDVWMARVLREHYLRRGPLGSRRVAAWALGHFGPWAGYAQHYLFHYRRVHGPLPRPRRDAVVAAPPASP